MAESHDGLIKLLQNNCVEGVFGRRHPKQGWQLHRRSFFTLSRKLLNSVPGRVGLHFKIPAQPPPYDAKSKNLITVWDIIMCDWRNFPLESLYVIKVIPVKTDKDMGTFWAYFDLSFAIMTPNMKKDFMNK